MVMVVLVLTFSSIPAFSQKMSERDVLHQLFEKGPTSINYTSQFASAVPHSVLDQIIDQLNGQLGTFVSVKGEKNPYSIQFEQGTATASIHLDGESRIAGLQFLEVLPANLSLEQAVEHLLDQQGSTSLVIRKNGKQLFAHNENTPLAVGSAFKLAVLAAIDDAVQAQELTYDQVVSLSPSWKSLPGGILQDWPSGTMLTIETLATLMISMSDNTAADALFSLVGREQVEKYLSYSLPALTTGEAFRLKNPDNDALLSHYRKGTITEKRGILSILSRYELPQASIFSNNPVALDIEWFMTTNQLSDLLERLAYLDLMTVNPGLAIPSSYQRVAFKGGSEPGVLNLSTFLIDKNGNSFTVSFTANREDAPVAETDIYQSYQALLQVLHQGK